MYNFDHLTREEKIKYAAELEAEIEEHKKIHYYHSNMEQSLKLVLNQEYGAISNQYYLMFNNNVAGSITYCGRELIQKMALYNNKYWHGMWHKDTYLHKKLNIKNVTQITESQATTIYSDTDSIFLSYDPAIKTCEWKNQVFNAAFLSSVDNNFMIITKDNKPLKDILSNPLFKGYINYSNDISNEYITDILEKNNIYTLLIDGFFLKKKQILNIIEKHKNITVLCNFEQELDFIHGLDYYRIAGYFKQCLDKHAAKYNVENVQEFELEKIADAVINIEKKRYVMNLVWEDGRYYDTLKNIQAKGFDIVRSSTPTFARGGKDKKDGVMKVINYLFQNPDSFDIKVLLHIVKELRREMELLPIDDICAQSSCSNYDTKVIDDKTSIQCVSGAHFAVKAAAYHNYLLYNNAEYHTKYQPIRSNEKVKYYYCKDDGIGGEVFAYKRGSFPIEFAPPVDYDESFYRFVMSPVNALVKTIGLPEISKRLTIVMDLFSGL